VGTFRFLHCLCIVATSSTTATRLLSGHKVSGCLPAVFFASIWHSPSNRNGLDGGSDDRRPSQGWIDMHPIFSQKSETFIRRSSTTLWFFRLQYMGRVALGQLIWKIQQTLVASGATSYTVPGNRFSSKKGSSVENYLETPSTNASSACHSVSNTRNNTNQSVYVRSHPEAFLVK
jgi:hypothetical protein